MTNKKQRMNVVKCNYCKKNITKTQESIQCNDECKGWFHQECTKLTKKEYEKYRNGKAKWICHVCSTQSSPDDESESEVDVSELEDIRDRGGSLGSTNRDFDAILKKSNPSNKDILQIISKKFDDLEKSVKFNSNILDDLQKTLRNLKKENKNLKKEQNLLREKVNNLERDMATIKLEASKQEVENSANVIVVGLHGGEDAAGDVRKVFKGLNLEVKDGDYSVQSLPSKSQFKPVLIKFKDIRTKRDLMELRRQKIKLETTECDIQGDKRNIYINEDLPKPVRELFREARELRKHGFRFVWCKMGTIYARRDEGQELVRIFSKEQITDIVKSQ